MPGRIFVSYRHEDEPAAAARVADWLRKEFGDGEVVIDASYLNSGEFWDQRLTEAVTKCEVLVAIIGPEWVDILKNKKADPASDDYLRWEIGLAWRLGKAVIPVLVGPKNNLPSLPSPDELPKELRNLLWRQHHDVRHEHYRSDIPLLVQDIRLKLRPRAPRIWMGTAAIAVSAVVGVAMLHPAWREWLPRLVRFTTIQRGDAVAPTDTARRISPTRTAVPLSAAEESVAQPGDAFKECRACPPMVVIPGGTFLMGSPPKEKFREPAIKGEESPQHPVKIPAPFAVGKYEVTFAEWDACEDCSHSPDDEEWGRGSDPVINVSWDDITQQYLPWLSKKTGKTYRLLSEAEWEYAARAGTTSAYAFGETISPRQAKFNDGKTDPLKNPAALKTVKVGSFTPNAFGLHDMHGNVWEWVQDCYNASYKLAPADGTAWNSAGNCEQRVVRGGSWDTASGGLRAARRLKRAHGMRNHFTGFRVARTL